MTDRIKADGELAAAWTAVGFGRLGVRVSRGAIRVVEGFLKTCG